MTFSNVLDKYRKHSFSERDKGDRFERLMQAYLMTDPKYAYRFKKIWLWEEFPGKKDLGGSDTGIDLVALTVEGDYWAIQCKCYREDAVIDKPAVDGFLSTSSRQFKNLDLKTSRFSNRLWISTTNKWGSNAEDAIRNQHPPVTRLNLFDLQESPVDWEKLEKGIHGEESRTPKKSLRPHQKEALEKAHKHFKTSDRGKLIMACGTGKTFAALRIAEHETDGKGLILFLVPSISLLGQTLREWSADAQEPINAICICSDPAVSKKRSKNDDGELFSVVDLALPASTDPEDILHQFKQIKAKGLPGMTVVFSTYQSIDVIAKTQAILIKEGFKEFDFIICDEAHRTTGVTLADEDESAFTKVHGNDFIKAKKRMYMTATPRLYSDDTKSKAAQADAVLCSMDDSVLYGEEIYRIGFGDAVEKGLLTDYKVLILTLNDKDVPEAYRRILTEQKVEINTDDASKLIGTINALSKQFLGDEGKIRETDPEPMRRAVAFCQTISVSKKIKDTYNTATEAYLSSLPAEKKDQMVSVEASHIDGTMTAPQRDELLGWLKAPTEGNECRILTNVRRLSEGVDVPSLDAVLFLSAKNSQVDVVQSVGRVMRKAPGKNYGYIIIPVIVPQDVEPDRALDDNERYKVVWTVLNALRAHDDRFNATVNKIELNKKRPHQILVGRPEYTFDGEGNPWLVREEDTKTYSASKQLVQQIALQFEQLQSVVFARMVQKVGDRRYWEQWAKDVALIANRQIERISYLIEEKEDQKHAFNDFLSGLQKNINPSIDRVQAVEMLAQHIITKPIFEALFEGYSFVKHNAVSTAMQGMLDALHDGNIVKDHDALQRFYDSVRKRAAGIDNADGKQRIIIELYDKFFKTAFPKMAEQLGIVYTPVEVVDSIIRSVDDVLKNEFDRSLSDDNIHILDPFTGTGTFITRMIQSGLIPKPDLTRKYHNELHANEIVLLAYYIAAVNIENAYHDLMADGTMKYEPFPGIVLTDTFQLSEIDENTKLFSDMFPQNSARVVRQKKAPLRVIMGNPPYSVGQKSANDNSQNQRYEKLDSRIADTYVKYSSAGLKTSLYDSYFKAFRWSTDRLDPKYGGIICFVSNSAWLDGNSADGFRKDLQKEFSSIWIINLRGNQRTSGELSRKEGGKIFGSGSRTPIAVTLLVKKPNRSDDRTRIYYYEVQDYLTREEKLSLLQQYRSIGNLEIPWRTILPNAHGDWITERNEIFKAFIPLYEKDQGYNAFFNFTSWGLKTNRDAWTYNSSKQILNRNLNDTINFYNEQRIKFRAAKQRHQDIDIDALITTDTKRISWSADLKKDLLRNKEYVYDDNSIVSSLYRPFFKQYLYFNESLVERPGQNRKLFPNKQIKNYVICVTGTGASKEFSALITDCIPNMHFLDTMVSFPLYYFDETTSSNTSLFENEATQCIRRDGISNFIYELAKKQYGKTITKEDIFFYAYGMLHSPHYKEEFANDLKKMWPRLTLLEDVRDF